MAIDTTVAGAQANSYLSVAEADALAADRIGPDYDSWVAAGEDEKEKALIRATEQCDGYVGSGSTPYSTTQALVYPRDLDLISGSPVIPGRVRLAAFEQAVYLRANAKALAESAARRARGLISFSDDDGGGTQALDATWGLMAPNAIVHLRAVPTLRRPTVVSVPLASSFPE